MKTNIKQQHPKLIALHTAGLTNRAIAKELGCTHRGVAYALGVLRLKTNGATRTPLVIKDGRGICTKCHKLKNLNQFRVQRSGAKYPYRLSYCNDCRKQQTYDSLNADPLRFLAYSYNNLKQRAKRTRQPFSLTKEWFIAQWKRQHGLCFYTDRPLRCRVNEGKSKDSFSVDKVIPEYGYTASNVVFCAVQVNTAKSDLTLEQLKEYTPGWYKRIQSRMG